MHTSLHRYTPHCLWYIHTSIYTYRSEAQHIRHRNRVIGRQGPNPLGVKRESWRPTRLYSIIPQALPYETRPHPQFSFILWHTHIPTHAHTHYTISSHPFFLSPMLLVHDKNLLRHIKKKSTITHSIQSSSDSTHFHVPCTRACI